MRITFRLNGVGYSGARNADFASIGTVRMIPGSVIGPPPLEAVTVTVAIPFFPSLVAVIVATPAATAVTSPLPLVAATAVLLLAHVTVRPVSTFPAESFVVADNWTVPPTGRLATAGVTSTDATGTAVTVTVALAAFPPG